MKYARSTKGGRLSQLARLCVAGLVATAAENAHAQLDMEANQAFDSSAFVTGAQQVTDVAFLADGRAVITLRNGDIWVWKGEDDIKKNAGKIQVASGHGEQGLLGVVALKSFREGSDGSEAQRTVFFYATASNGGPNPHKVFKGVVGADDNVTIDTASPIAEGLAGTANHNGGGLIVAGNQLYVAVGDTGANATPPQNKFSTCLNKPHGKILRLNFDGTIPTDNPLANEAMVTSCETATGNLSMAAPDKRIYAWGLRNPWRFWVDPATGSLWVGDVGETTKEEVSVGTKGTHFGYPFEEGTVKYQQSWNNMGCQGTRPARACTPPQHDWNRVQNGPNCSIGGLIPDGDNGQLAGNGKKLCGWPEAFKSRYFFGDHGSGDVWTADVKADRTGIVAGSVKRFGRFPNVSGFRIGFGDSLYVVATNTGSIRKITPKNYDAVACAQVAMPPVGGAGGNDGGGGASAGSGGTTGNSGGLGGTGSGGTAGGLDTGGAGAGGSATAGASGSGGGSDDAQDTADGTDGCGCAVFRTRNGAGGLVAASLFALGFLVMNARRRRP